MDGDAHNQPLLELRELRTAFAADGSVVTAVDGVSLQIPFGKTVALVGESGCGKSVTAMSILRLIPSPPAAITGRILLRERPHAAAIDVLALPERDMRQVRGRRIAMVFQEPMAALNPVYTVGEQIIEAIELHQVTRGQRARARALDMLRKVGIADPHLRVDDYPHQMSGGMCQRVMIAMALACEPMLLIADEPTTALDVTVQRQILDLLRSLQAQSHQSLLIITHDLGVVAHIADLVYVMYAGRIVEHAPVGKLLSQPVHPYTQALLRCTPRLSHDNARAEVIPGSVPDLARPPRGCRFHPRCGLSRWAASLGGRAAMVMDGDSGGIILRRCIEGFPEEPSGIPPLREIAPNHFVACWEASLQA